MPKEPWLELPELMSADPVKGAYLSWHTLGGSGEPLFRHALWRVWDRDKPLLAVIGHNPSTADASRDDMTVAKLIGFAKPAGYGGFVLGNIYAYRASDPMALLTVGTRNATGFGNANWIEAIVASRDCLVVWGATNLDPDLLREVEVLIMGRAARTFCLGVTREGFPRHPARIGYDTPWEEWTPERRRA